MTQYPLLFTSRHKVEGNNNYLADVSIYGRLLLAEEEDGDGHGRGSGRDHRDESADRRCPCGKRAEQGPVGPGASVRAGSVLGLSVRGRREESRVEPGASVRGTGERPAPPSAKDRKDPPADEAPPASPRRSTASTRSGCARRPDGAAARRRDTRSASCRTGRSCDAGSPSSTPARRYCCPAVRRARQEERQRRPVVAHVGDRVAHAGIGLHPMLVELLA